MRSPLDAVDQHEGAGPGVDRTDTADGDFAAVGTGTSRSLHDADTRHQALEGRRKVGGIALDDVLSGDRRDGAGEGDLLLNLVSDHDDVVDLLVLGFKGDVEFGPVVHRNGTAVVTDAADGQRNRSGRQRDGVGTVHARGRRDHRLRSFDDDRRTDHGLPVVETTLPVRVSFLEAGVDAVCACSDMQPTDSRIRSANFFIQK